MRLAHLHLPGLVPFTQASRLQQTLVSRFLAYKKLSDSSPSLVPPPDPTILTFTPHPTYTTGRRDLPHPNPSDDKSSSNSRWLPTPLEPVRQILTSSPPLAEYHATLRGGQTTFHGPGQMVAYTILDLRSLKIGPRAHIRLIEESTQDTLANYGVKGVLTDDPGVWVSTKRGTHHEALRKIAAVGVHLRRFVSSYGLALNVTEEPIWFLKQISACGLEGKDPTSLEAHGVRSKGGLEEVSETFVKKFIERLNKGTASGGIGPKVNEVYRIKEKDDLD